MIKNTNLRYGPRITIPAGTVLQVDTADGRSYEGRLVSDYVVLSNVTSLDNIDGMVLDGEKIPAAMIIGIFAL